MRYPLSELEIRYLMDLFDEIKDGLTEDVIDEIENAQELLDGVYIREQKQAQLDIARERPISVNE